jgi:hypothetical protein
VKNPYPITRARRIEMRRKQMGYATRCFYCSETDIFCFEEDHPVTEGLDADFRRAVCRNCHRKLEARRDIKGLTKNGQHAVKESEREALRRYLLLLAEDEESQAELLRQDPKTPTKLIITASQARAASLRRKAQALSLGRPCARSRKPSCRAAVTSKRDARRRRSKALSA